MILDQASIQDFLEQYDRLLDIRELGKDEATALKACTILENLLKRAYLCLIPRLNYPIRAKLAEAEKSILSKERTTAQGSENDRGIESFTFGNVQQFFQKNKLFQVLAEESGKEAYLVPGDQLHKVIDIRNKMAHGSYIPTRDELILVLSVLDRMLVFLDIPIPSTRVKLVQTDVEEMARLYATSIAKVEIIEGTSEFFSKVEKLTGGDDYDVFDLCYVIEDPVVSRGDFGGAYALSQQHIINRVRNGTATVRRIVNLNSPQKAAWVLFSLVGPLSSYLGKELKIGVFESKNPETGGFVLAPSLVLFYNSTNIGTGLSWFGSANDEFHQQYCKISGPSIFPAFRRLYANWFSSCQKLTLESASAEYIRFFGKPSSPEQVRETAMKYQNWLNLHKDDLEVSVAFWTSTLLR